MPSTPETSLWQQHHRLSETLAVRAEQLARAGDTVRAAQEYEQAARHETAALRQVPPGKSRTLGILAVSATALWYKADCQQEAKDLAREYLAVPELPDFSRHSLLDI
jgi:hypothetical protein